MKTMTVSMCPLSTLKIQSSWLKLRKRTWRDGQRGRGFTVYKKSMMMYLLEKMQPKAIRKMQGIMENGNLKFLIHKVKRPRRKAALLLICWVIKKWKTWSKKVQLLYMLQNCTIPSWRLARSQRRYIGLWLDLYFQKFLKDMICNRKLFHWLPFLFLDR